MKIRNGFVSNSSSSSFIIKVDETKTETLVSLVEGYKYSKDKTIFGIESFFGTNKALQEKLKERIKLSKEKLINLLKVKKFTEENLKNKDFLEFLYCVKNVPKYAQDEYAKDRLINELNIVIKLSSEITQRSEEILKLIKPYLLDELIVIFNDDLNLGIIDKIKQEDIEIIKKESN